MPPNTIGQPKRATQRRIIALFRDELNYRYLDDWTDRPNYDTMSAILDEIIKFRKEQAENYEVHKLMA